MKKSRAPPPPEEYDDDEDEDHNKTFCGTCSGLYNANEFWIACDMRAVVPRQMRADHPRQGGAHKALQVP
jgi:hypothetical protein